MDSINPKTMFPSSLPQITTEKLDGQNYIQWSKAVRVYFAGMGKSDHLLQSGPLDEKRKEVWIQEDALLVSLLWNSMDSQIAQMCMHLDTCMEIWDYVKLLYSSNITRIYDLS